MSQPRDGRARRNDPHHHGDGVPFVTVIMPVRNEERHISRSLAAVVRQQYPARKYELLIADGMSTDATRAMAAAVLDEFSCRGGRGRIIDNRGRTPPSGLNQALKHATGSVVVRVDGHCEVPPDYLRRCIELLEATGADTVGGVIEAHGQGAFGTAISLAMRCPFGVGNARFRVGGKSGWVDTVAFPASRRGVFDLVGPFREDLWPNEDDEYHLRLHRLGGRIWLEESLQVVYYSRSTLADLWRQYWRYGLLKLRVMREHKTVQSVRSLVPLAFLLLCCGALLTWLVAGTALYVSAAAAAYSTIAIGAAITNAVRYRRRAAVLMPIVFAVMHVAYGAGMCWGIWKWRRVPLLQPGTLPGARS